MKFPTPAPEALARRAFFLAWTAAGRPTNAGWLRNKPDATEADVWENVRTRGDYPGGALGAARPGEAYGDYVFGRMLKLSLSWGADSVTARDDTPRRDYQGWAGVYPTYAALLTAAAESLAAASKS